MRPRVGPSVKLSTMDALSGAGRSMAAMRTRLKGVVPEYEDEGYKEKILDDHDHVKDHGEMLVEEAPHQLEAHIPNYMGADIVVEKLEGRHHEARGRTNEDHAIEIKERTTAMARERAPEPEGKRRRIINNKVVIAMM